MQYFQMDLAANAAFARQESHDQKSGLALPFDDEQAEMNAAAADFDGTWSWGDTRNSGDSDRRDGRSSGGAMGMNDARAVLGVRAGCDEREVRAAYRKHALKLHPDKGGAAEAFRVLCEAYAVLQPRV